MSNHKLLIANRGEIAIRIINAAYELGIPTVTVFPADDRATLHTKKSDETYLVRRTWCKQLIWTLSK